MPNESTSYRLSWRDRLPRPWGSLFAFSWIRLGIVVVVALVLSQQILAPNPRVIKLIAGMALFVAAYRARPFWALCMIVLFFPFPFSIFVGDSTMIFIVLVALVYLARLTLGQVPALRGTPVDAGMALLITAYVLSFSNIDNTAVLKLALIQMTGITASFILFYMTANFIRTERELRIFVRILLIMVGLSVLVGLFELFFPGKVLVPHWILPSEASLGIKQGYRVGGPLYDYELMGEFMALAFFLTVFGFRRAEGANSRFFAGTLVPLTVFTLLVTVTRGAILSFFGGVLYLAWRMRRSLKFRDVVLVLLVAVGAYLVMDFFIVHFTRSGGIMDRLLSTRIQGGIPTARSHWPGVLARALDHPFVGHGPHVDLGRTQGITGRGLYTHLWPHNQYLFYLHTVGFVGLSAFLFITVRLLVISSKRAATNLRASYPASLMLVLHVMMLVFLVDQIKIDYLRNPSYKYFPWIMMGLVVATLRIMEAQGKAAGTTPQAAGPPGPGLPEG
jgi:O-antigen ligase